MVHHVFLSHDSRDHVIADVLAHTISRMSLGQISVWHSSDSDAAGGLRPGTVWLDEIRGRLAASKALIVLLTPQSVTRPWLLFESGYGAASPGCYVIPVCVGVDSVTDVPYPLAMYQSYLLSDYNSLRRFADKLFARYEIPFDETMTKPVLEEAVRGLLEAISASVADQPPTRPKTVDELAAEVKEHLDKRLVGLLSSGILNSATPSRRHDYYTVPIDLGEGVRNPRQQLLEVGVETSVQDALDAVFRFIDDEFRAFTYLDKWLLREVGTGHRLVVVEVGGRVPASTVFRPGSKWEVVRLNRPYSPADSMKEAERWYGAP